METQTEQEQYFQELFNLWNKDKFENKLPEYRVILGGLHSYFGRVLFDDKIIKIRIIEDKEHMKNTLLYEMIHAEINRRKFKNKSHSVRFWRMFKEKGGIITNTNQQCFKKAILVANEKSGVLKE